MSATTIVYLLHFAQPYRHARHYIGSTSNLQARLDEHRRGTGARLTAVIAAAGISFELARAWRGGRKVERRLKTLGGAARLCPICSPNRKWGAFAPAHRPRRAGKGPA